MDCRVRRRSASDIEEQSSSESNLGQDIQTTNVLQALLFEKTKRLRADFEKSIRNLNENVIDQIDEIKAQISSSLPGSMVITTSSSGASNNEQQQRNSTKPNQKRRRRKKSVSERKDDLKTNTPSRKVFVARTSILNDLFEFSHIKTIRHVFIAVMIVFALQAFLHDLIDDRKILPDYSLIFWCFGKLSIAFHCWLEMIGLSLVALYAGFHCWASSRTHLSSKAYDRIFLGLFVVYVIFFFYFPLKCVIVNRLPLATACSLLMEQVRMIMKQYAFVRESTPGILKGDNKIPNYSKYLYFMFAPTLVYRDEYPRTPEIRWRFVVENLVEVGITIVYSYYVFLRVSVPRFRDFSGDNLDLTEFIYAVFSCILPGSLLLLLIFYGFLHCWLNAFAEMLRFADRMFYKDWWNSNDYRGYYRTWNVVVHDWLYNYVYIDLLEVFGSKYKILASFFVVTMSSIVHEYVFTFMFGYFYPVNLVLFGCIGFLMTLVPKSNPESSLHNILFWVSFLIGLGVNVSMCSMGYFARKHCNLPHWKWGIVLPRRLICAGT